MKMVFVIGTGRCGSTLLHEIIAKHENIGFISNIDDNFPYLNLKGRFNNIVYRSPIGKFTKKGRFRFAPSEAYKLFEYQISPLYGHSSRDLNSEDVTPWLQRRIHKFFHDRYKLQSKDVFLHKYTGWSRIGFFAKIFPDAKFIHIVRDGRAVANSWLKMQWWGGYRGPENWLWGPLQDEYELEWAKSGHSFVRLAAIGWKILLESHEKSSFHLGKNQYLQLRFEDFIDSPKEFLEKILHFSELETTKHFKKHLDKQKIYLDRKFSYIKDLSTSQLDEMNESLLSKLHAYGYAM